MFVMFCGFVLVLYCVFSDPDTGLNPSECESFYNIRYYWSLLLKKLYKAREMTHRNISDTESNALQRF